MYIYICVCVCVCVCAFDGLDNKVYIHKKNLFSLSYTCLIRSYDRISKTDELFKFFYRNGVYLFTSKPSVRLRGYCGTMDNMQCALASDIKYQEEWVSSEPIQRSVLLTQYGVRHSRCS